MRPPRKPVSRTVAELRTQRQKHSANHSAYQEESSHLPSAVFAAPDSDRLRSRRRGSYTACMRVVSSQVTRCQGPVASTYTRGSFSFSSGATKTCTRTAPGVDGAAGCEQPASAWNSWTSIRGAPTLPQTASKTSALQPGTSYSSLHLSKTSLSKGRSWSARRPFFNSSNKSGAPLPTAESYKRFRNSSSRMLTLKVQRTSRGARDRSTAFMQGNIVNL
mmetsp:Transcript_79874/g.230900  ORF Transcript_79874/g.230900 Transcript_79874/m.230900 type:complete len:219 (-) Transcript_79874:278-934(-)